MQTSISRWDARYFQILFQGTFLTYGLAYLGWQAEWLQFTLYIGSALLFQWLFDSGRQKKWQPITGANSFLKQGGLSALISAASLCLLLKTNDWRICILASFISIASKFIIRFRGKHIFNPSALGIVAVIYFTNNAWLTPAQWGSNTVIFFMVATLGTIVITRVQKLDVCLAFLFTFLGCLFYRQVIYQNWPADHFWHSMSTGSLLLFTFFMISDPKTAPNHPLARVLWGSAVGALAFYMSAFKFMNATPIKALVLLAPLVPVLDALFKSRSFQWNKTATQPASSFFAFSFLKQKSIFMKKVFGLLLGLAVLTNDGFSFCGFYVAKADGTLKNKTSQVILVRDGNRNIITMYNDFKGDMKDFAMVVPVPTVLAKDNIKVIDQGLFARLNDYSQPRLVEYWDQNPCDRNYYGDKEEMKATDSNVAMSAPAAEGGAKRKLVKIEAQYLVGEYDILILSAQESGALKEWLTQNGYKIPAGAEEVLEPYIKSNLKFFVVKVNMAAKKKIAGDFLRPIQIKYNSPKFMLPIRLGMANADGDQDMIVYAFTRKGRVECTNYRTTELPTGNNVPLFVQQNFGTFYGNLFQHQWNKQGKDVVMMEYAWDVSPKNYVKCDPCVGNPPTEYDIVQAGVWWLNKDWNDYSDVDSDESYDKSDNVFFTRLHVRYNRQEFPQDLTFQVTPNTANYQARYVITHPATGNFDCEAGKKYLQSLKKRRKTELEQLLALTGKSYADWDMAYEEGTSTTDEDKAVAEEARYSSVAANVGKSDDNNGNGPNGGLIFAGALLGMGIIMALRKRGVPAQRA
jgi:Na+-translocating ferredoxin:NAD+ oxidoreductase RnfD subunit